MGVNYSSVDSVRDIVFLSPAPYSRLRPQRTLSLILFSLRTLRLERSGRLKNNSADPDSEAKIIKIAEISALFQYIQPSPSGLFLSPCFL